MKTQTSTRISPVSLLLVHWLNPEEKLPGITDREYLLGRNLVRVVKGDLRRAGRKLTHDIAGALDHYITATLFARRADVQAMKSYNPATLDLAAKSHDRLRTALAALEDRVGRDVLQGVRTQHPDTPQPQVAVATSSVNPHRTNGQANGGAAAVQSNAHFGQPAIDDTIAATQPSDNGSHNANPAQSTQSNPNTNGSHPVRPAIHTGSLHPQPTETTEETARIEQIERELRSNLGIPSDLPKPAPTKLTRSMFIDPISAAERIIHQAMHPKPVEVVLPKKR